MLLLNIKTDRVLGTEHDSSYSLIPVDDLLSQIVHAGVLIEILVKYKDK